MVYVDNNGPNSFYYTGALTAFDTATGTQQWRFVIPDPYQSQSPTVANGIVYETNPISIPDLGAFDALTGASLWQNANPAGFEWNPAVVGSTIYVGCAYHPLAAVDVQTHALKWLYVDSALASSPIVNGSSGSPTVDGANVFIPVYNNDLYAIDTTGILVWKFSLANGTPVTGEFNSPVTGNGLLFAGNANNVIYAMDERTGSVKWQYGTPVGGSGFVGQPTFSNGTLYCGCTSGNFCAFDASTGNLKWTFTTGGIVSSGPCVTDAKGNVAHPGSSGDHQ
jgi:outer membrane protein assembly factor BamB